MWYWTKKSGKRKTELAMENPLCQQSKSKVIYQVIWYIYNIPNYPKEFILVLKRETSAKC